MSFWATVLTVTWAIVIVLSFAVGGLLYQVNELKRAIGTTRPAGSTLSSRVLGTSLAVLGLPSTPAGLIALVGQPNCPGCAELLRPLGELANQRQNGRNPESPLPELGLLYGGPVPEEVIKGAPVLVRADIGAELTALGITITPMLIYSRDGSMIDAIRIPSGRGDFWEFVETYYYEKIDQIQKKEVANAQNG